MNEIKNYSRVYNVKLCQAPKYDKTPLCTTTDKSRAWDSNLVRCEKNWKKPCPDLRIKPQKNALKADNRMAGTMGEQSKQN